MQITFPQNRSEYSNYIYQSNEGLVNILFISKHPGNQIEYISYVNQSKEIYSRPLTEFVEVNFTPIMQIGDMQNLSKEISQVKGLTTFSSSFQDVLP